MTKEEKFIMNLRALRRRQIIGSLIAIVAIGTCLGFLLFLKGQYQAMVSPESISQMLPPNVSANQLPEVLSVLQCLARADAELAASIKIFSFLIGAMIGLFVVAVFDLSQRRVLINMWDRIQRLEKELEDIKGQSGPRD